MIGTGSGPVLVTGYRAGGIAAALATAGGTAVTARSATAALVGGEGLEFDASVGGLGLPPGSAAAVIVRRTWRNAAGLQQTFRDVMTVLAPGGTAVIGDVDVVTLASAIPGRYPSQHVLRMVPDATRRLTETSAEARELAIEAIRVRLDGVAVIEVDETYGTFATARDHLAFIRNGGWPVLGVVGDAAAMESIVVGYAAERPEGAVVEREPWIYSVGRRPG